MRLFEHPNLLRSLDEGAVGPVPYLVVEFCAYGDLEAIVARYGGRLPAWVAVRIATQILDGLQPIHARGWVHGDIKPGNVFVTLEGGNVRVKLADLGLSHSFEKGGQTCMPRPLYSTCVGRPDYVSPEQARDFTHVQPTSDVWSVGATLYFMLCGAPPRDCPDGVEMWAAVLSGTVVPLSVRLKGRPSDAPSSLMDVVARALEAVPGQEFPSAWALREALQDAMA